MNFKGSSITRGRTWGFGVIAGVVAVAALTADAPRHADWPMFGQNLQNTASVGKGSASNFSHLKLKWTFTTGGDVSARAAVVNGVAYFPDWGGTLWALNARNGQVVWSHQFSDYGLPANTHSRTSPTVADGVLYMGTQEGGWLLAIIARTGELLWKTQVESPAVDPFTQITSSPVGMRRTVHRHGLGGRRSRRHPARLRVLQGEAASLRSVPTLAITAWENRHRRGLQRWRRVGRLRDRPVARPAASSAPGTTTVIRRTRPTSACISSGGTPATYVRHNHGIRFSR